MDFGKEIIKIDQRSHNKKRNIETKIRKDRNKITLKYAHSANKKAISDAEKIKAFVSKHKAIFRMSPLNLDHGLMTQRVFVADSLTNITPYLCPTKSRR